MKLFIKPGACSLSPHIAACEAGVAVAVEPVDLAAKTLADGSTFWAVNPKGQVPALLLDSGDLLTEGAVIAQYLAEQAGRTDLLPASGLPRYRVLEWLNFVSTELHKGFSPLFRPTTPDAFKVIAKETLLGKLGYVEQALAGQDYLTGATFTIADGYLFTVLRWTKAVGIDLTAFPGLAAYLDRVAARPAVRQAMGEEGLL